MRACDGEKYALIEDRGVSRRDFMKFCTTLAATMGLPMGFGSKIAHAITNPKRPPVLWLSLQQCTGCSETLLRTNHPTLDRLILEILSLDYHETLSVAAGLQAEEAKAKSMAENKGRYVLVVDGSVPLKDGGIYVKIGGRTGIELLKEASAGAAAVIAMGSCASWGGIPSSGPNPTGAVGINEVIEDKPVVTIPGCPPNPYNFLATVVHFLTFKKLPDLDDKGRPRFAYGRIVHENCERRPHFDAGRFANEFGDEGHRKGYCLFKLGCKGPETFANCPAVGFNDVGQGNWPVGIGHPCFGCTEQGVGFTIPLHQTSKVRFVTPPAGYPGIVEEKGSGAGIAATALFAGVAGAALGAGAMIAKDLGREEKNTKKKPGSSKNED